MSNQTDFPTDLFGTLYAICGAVMGFIAFGAAWWGCIMWGGFMGMLLGWIPAALAGVIVFWIGPALAIFGITIYGLMNGV